MRGTLLGRFVTLFGIAASVALATSISTGAEAAPIPQRAPLRIPAGDHNKIGNGKANNTTVAIRSPAEIHGIQHVTVSNAGGLININTALCKKNHRCRIRQRTYKHTFKTRR